MRASDRAEEILEELYVLIKERNVNPVAISDLSVKGNASELKELVGLQYITISGDRIELTSRGLEEAEAAIRRHRLAERLVMDVFDLKRSLMEEKACQFEHLIRKEVEESICTLLGHPKVCPHNRPIPPGRCCRNALRQPKSIVSSLAEMEGGVSVAVAYLVTRDDRKLQKLMSMGILPGVRIDVIQTFPSHVFRIGHSVVAVDREMAKDIFVRRIK